MDSQQVKISEMLRNNGLTPIIQNNPLHEINLTKTQLNSLPSQISEQLTINILNSKLYMNDIKGENILLHTVLLESVKQEPFVSSDEGSNISIYANILLNYFQVYTNHVNEQQNIFYELYQLTKPRLDHERAELLYPYLQSVVAFYEDKYSAFYSYHDDTKLWYHVTTQKSAKAELSQHYSNYINSIMDILLDHNNETDNLIPREIHQTLKDVHHCTFANLLKKFGIMIINNYYHRMYDLTNHILRFLYNPGILDKINSMPCYSLKDCKVFDLTTGKIRDRKKTDYWTLTFARNYISPENRDQDKIDKVMKFYKYFTSGQESSVNINHKYDLIKKFKLNEIQITETTSKVLCDGKIIDKIKYTHTYTCPLTKLLTTKDSSETGKFYEHKLNKLEYTDEDMISFKYEKCLEMLNDDKYMNKNDVISVCQNYKSNYENYITKYKELSLFESQKICNDFNEHLLNITGYFVTPYNMLQKFYLFIGQPSSGKSVYFRILELCFGEIVKKVQVETILGNKNSNGGSGSSVDKVDILDSWFSFTEELESGARISENFLSNYVGGGTVSCRSHHQGQTRRVPKGKIGISGNVDPTFEVSGGLPRRAEQFECKALFNKIIKNNDIDKGHYIVDLNYIEKLKGDVILLDTFFSIIADRAAKFSDVNNRNIDTPEFIETNTNILIENIKQSDPFVNFIRDRLETVPINSPIEPREKKTAVHKDCKLYFENIGFKYKDVAKKVKETLLSYARTMNGTIKTIRVGKSDIEFYVNIRIKPQTQNDRILDI